MELAKPLENEKSSKMMGGIAALYGAYGGADKYEFFEEIMTGNSLQGYDIIGVLGAYTGFVGRQDYETFEKSYDLYQNVYEEGGVYTQMFMPQFINYVKKGCGKKIDELKEELKKELPEGVKTLFISSVAQQGLTELKDNLWQLLND